MTVKLAVTIVTFQILMVNGAQWHAKSYPCLTPYSLLVGNSSLCDYLYVSGREERRNKEERGEEKSK